MRSAWVGAVLIASALLVGACGSKAGVGESCVSADDCDSNLCNTGGSFPGGVCTVSCDANVDCPTGFLCISRSSGMCLRSCTSDDACEALRGADWQCREESLEEGGGNRMVCIGD